MKSNNSTEVIALDLCGLQATPTRARFKPGESYKNCGQSNRRGRTCYIR